MQFPDDATLVARGKYSTLGKERRKQLERVQGICSALMSATQGALRDCEALPPVNNGHVESLGKFLENLKDARGKLVEISMEMNSIKAEAWPE